MGCAASGSVNDQPGTAGEGRREIMLWLDKTLVAGDGHRLVSVYIEVENDILTEESQSPASVLGFALSRQQQIRSLIESTDDGRHRDAGPENAIHEMLVDLGLHRGPAVASEHEEFVAVANRRALGRNMMRILERIMAAAEEQIRSASLRIAHLQALYEKRDLLLERVYGGEQGSDEERRLAEEMDVLRSYRDAFCYGIRRWEGAAESVDEAARMLLRSIAAWRSVHTSWKLEGKIDAATEARNSTQEAVILIQLCHDSMPDVPFPYCTRRELAMISQMIEYTYTDILITDRYCYAKQVYKTFQQRASSLSKWINQVLHSRLKNDLVVMDRNARNISESLRNERIKMMCKKLKIANGCSAFGRTLRNAQ